jgi:hypothetical protein
MFISALEHVLGTAQRAPDLGFAGFESGDEGLNPSPRTCGCVGVFPRMLNQIFGIDDGAVKRNSLERRKHSLPTGVFDGQLSGGLAIEKDYP